MTRVTQMGGVEAQGQQQAQQQAQEAGKAPARKDTEARIAQAGDGHIDQRGGKPTTFTDWAAI